MNAKSGPPHALWPALLPALVLKVFVILPSVHANGGGYFTRGVDQTGMIQSFQPDGTERVAIIQEDLDILLRPNSALVEVRYIMRNVSNQNVRARFGFPVEEIVADKRRMEYLATENKGVATPPKQLEACRNYRVELGGKPLEAKFIPQDTKPDERFIGLRGWLVSEARFDKGEEKTMTIRFEADHITSGHSVSEDSSFDAKLFKYRLSTGAAWHGPIRKGRVTVRSEGIRQEEVMVKSPVNRFRRSTDGWEWSFRDLEPTLEDDLVIQAVAPVSSYGWRTLDGRHFTGEDNHAKAADLIQRGERWFMEHSNYSIKASSTLPDEGDISYQAENLQTWQQAWSEGAPGNGVGQWIEIKPEVPQPLEALIIYSGHPQEDLHAANARPSQIQVTLNGEHSFNHFLEDTQDAQLIQIQNYSKPVRQVQLTFLSVYEGTEFQDMCLAHVRLVSALSKPPKIQPSR